MNEHIFLIVWLGIWWYLSKRVNMTEPIKVLGKIEYRWKLPFAILIFLPIFLVASLGTPIGDIPAYLMMYDQIPVSLGEFLHYLRSLEDRHGFALLSYIVKILSGGSDTAYRVVIASVQSIPLIWVFRKYSVNYLVTVFLFVASASHMSWMMNGLRQFVAVTMIFMATDWLLERKYISYGIVVLLAATMHTTAIMMIPIALIVQGRAWNARTVLFIAASVVGMYVFGTYTGLLDSMFEETTYAGAIGNAMSEGDDGTNPLRVLVNAIPLVIALVGKKQVDWENDPVANMCINATAISTGLYLISMVTSGITIGRLPIYVSLYGFILLPYLIKTVFTERSVRLVNIGMIGLYLAYYYYQMHVAWGYI